MGATGLKETQVVIRTAFNETFAIAGEAIALAPNLAEDRLALALFAIAALPHNSHGGP